MNLAGHDLKKLVSILLSAYPSKDDLATLVKFELDENLDTIIGGKTLKDIIFNLIIWAESRGKLEKLLSAISQDRPNKQELQELINTLLHENLPREQSFRTKQSQDQNTLPDRLSQDFIQQEKNEVFISYSHKDKEWLEKLQIMLKPLLRKQVISVWDDTKIKAGSKWRNEIKIALDSAKIAVLMVSPNFLNSEFIDKHELPPLLQAAESEGLTIIWICVSDCLYEETKIVEYQASHDISEPLDSLSQADLNRVLKTIAKQIKEAI